MTERMAPGHLYQPKLGTGIEWIADEVHLWEGGKITETAHHATASAYEFWHSLAFAEAFPTVSHWWFRSAWTQRVRLSGIQGTLAGGAVWGYMQFIDEQVPAQTWSVTEGERPEIFVPFSPNEVQPVNLPLRLALARLAAGIVADEVQRDKWFVVTSLVHRDELAQAFSDTQPWQLEGVHIPIRDALCNLQGIRQPTALLTQSLNHQMNLLIVESPTKARLVAKYARPVLGKDVTVRACFGHLRDLPEGELGVDVECGFLPRYLIQPKREDLVRELRTEILKSETIYLATDPDREGEAVAWHICQVFKAELKSRQVWRISFNEVTERAVQKALKNPRRLDIRLVQAAVARRVMDRLVGYIISPILWKHVRVKT